MKYINKLLLFTVGCLFIISCTVNDPLDDVVDAGQFVPTVYWNVENASATAGSSVSFNAQYYSTLRNSDISHLEVWYSISQTASRSVKCVLFAQQGLPFEMASDELIKDVRPSLLIESYPHDETYWSESKQCYEIRTSFPVVYNLNRLVWGKDPNFDRDGYEKYFPENYLELFRDSLYSQMNAYNFKKLLTGDYPRVSEDEFATFTYNVYNEESNDSVLQIKSEYTATVKELMYSIPVDSLMYDSENSIFLISYDRQYSLDAKLKVIDKNNNIGVSESKSLTIN